MVGGHLDSWASGTGATDNGAGTVVAMEVMRILNALHVKPRRTIRVGLWTGEEQGVFGSRLYVKQHFGYVPLSTAPDEMKKPEWLRKPAGPLELKPDQQRYPATSMWTMAAARSAEFICRKTPRWLLFLRNGLNH